MEYKIRELRGEFGPLYQVLGSTGYALMTANSRDLAEKEVERLEFVDGGIEAERKLRSVVEYLNGRLTAIRKSPSRAKLRDRRIAYEDAKAIVWPILCQVYDQKRGGR